VNLQQNYKMNNKKKIGIPGWLIDGKCFGVTLPYINYISKFGIPIIITPNQVNDLPEIDLLYLPGGLDVNPLNYNEMPGYYTQNPNVMLEYFDKHILPKYIENNTSIFAVCRGAQSLFTMYGGTLIQDFKEHKQSGYPTDQCHLIKPKDASLYKNYNELFKNLKVNSRHHQMMIDDGKSNEIDIIAVAEDFTDIVEVWKHKTKDIWGVQYHPEDHGTNDKFSPFVINNLLNK
jgi:putative glutamine amidotransferase